MDSLRKAEQSAKKLFGADIQFLLARAPAFGSDDCCILVMGKNHLAAAQGFARVVKGGVKITEERSSGFMSIKPYTYSSVTFAAQTGATA